MSIQHRGGGGGGGGYVAGTALGQRDGTDAPRTPGAHNDRRIRDLTFGLQPDGLSQTLSFAPASNCSRASPP